MFVYIPDLSEGTLEVYNTKGDLTRTLSLSDIQNLPDGAKVGLVCYEIAKGKSVDKAATGNGGRLSIDRFFLLVEGSKEYKAMYIDALRKRIFTLQESMVDMSEASDVKRVEALIKGLQTTLASEIDSEGKFEEIKFNTFLSKDKLKEIRRENKTLK